MEESKYPSMHEFLPLIGKLEIQKPEPQELAQKEIPKETNTNLIFEDLFSDVIDEEQPFDREESSKKIKVEPKVEEEFKLENDFNLTPEQLLGDFEQPSSLIDISNESVELFPEEPNFIKKTPFHSAEKSIVIPKEEIVKVTDGDEEQNELVKNLLFVHLKQEQEIRDLRKLVAHLQNLLLAANTKNVQSNYPGG